VSQTYALSFAGYSATIRSLGGALSSLEYLERPLVEAFNWNEERALYQGNNLAPWPNRIRDGRYEIGLRTFQLPITEAHRNNALHGLINSIEWQLVEKTDQRVILETLLLESEYYPSSLKFSVVYELDSIGLNWKLVAENVGNDLAPYGASIHPYLIGDPKSTVNEWTLFLPCKKYLKVDSKRLLPTGLDSCEGDFAFQLPRIIGSLSIDHAFRIDPDNKNQRIEVRAPSNFGVWMEYDKNSKWIQIHTADRDDGPGTRGCLAVEPMTCPADAFNSRVDLLWIRPGHSHSMQWQIGALV
jgi:aldose 1-epimerase